MASSRISEREEERRFNLRTLAIASAASATAAVVTSQLWIAGTWLAAAVTPVLVALISELLHRPTERIAERLSAERPAPQEPPAPEQRPAREEQPSPGSAPIRIYRSSAPQPRRRKIALGAVLSTAALALLIAAAVLTVSELAAGGAVGRSERSTTFFSGDRDRASSKDRDSQQRPESTQQSAPETDATIEQPTGEEPTTPSPTEPPTVTTTPPEQPPTETTPTAPP